MKLDPRVMNGPRGNSGDEDRDRESDDGTGDRDDRLRRVLRCELRARGTEPDEGDGAREDAGDGGENVAAVPDAGQAESVVHEEKGKNGRQANQRDDLGPLPGDGAVDGQELR